MYNNNDNNYTDIVRRLKAHYPPPKVSVRVKMVRELMKPSGMTIKNLAETIGFSLGHAHQLVFLSQNATDDELQAIDDLNLTVSGAYLKIKKRVEKSPNISNTNTLA